MPIVFCFGTGVVVIGSVCHVGPRAVSLVAVGTSKSVHDSPRRVSSPSELCGRYRSGNVDWWVPVEGEILKAELIRGSNEAFWKPVSMFDAVGVKAVRKKGNNKSGQGIRGKSRHTIHWVVVQRNYERYSSGDGHLRDCTRPNATHVLRSVDQGGPQAQIVWISRSV